jgi:uncharacterized protein (DUF697 family)/tellurite resistance protein
MAAFADGANSETERAELKRMAETVLGDKLHAASLYQNVLLGRTTRASAAAALAGGPAAQLAYEMAACVCEADDAVSEPEKRFLADLRSELGLNAENVVAVTAAAGQLATAPLTPPPLPATPPATGATEKLILNYALLNGALELLPESLATMAIIPMQMKMVYRVGLSHGVQLDRGHIKEFAATAGLGLTSQVVEGFARKLLAGVFGKKGMVKNMADQVTSSAFSFASTYALGQVADRYYAGGRSMTTAELKSLFDATVAKARGLHAQYLPQIQEKAANLDLGQLIAEVRSGQHAPEQGAAPADPRQPG